MILEISDLSKNFGGIKAVEKFNIKIEDREIVGLIGPNGAGKSTVFNCITGIYQPDSGSVKYRGTELINLKSHKIAEKGISRTFQNLQLFQNLTTYENILIANHIEINTGLISEGFKLKKCRAAEKIAKEKTESLINFFGLNDYAQKIVKQIPLGHQKLIEIARILAMDPKLILLDEAVGGLNQDEKRHLMELIRSIHSRWQLTIFLIDHDMGLVMEICDKVAVMNFGKLIAIGTPEEIKNMDIVIEAYIGKDMNA